MARGGGDGADPAGEDPPGLLVVVHPGSACGSADFNLGARRAALAREGLARDMGEWRGHVLVVDGELSDEIPGRPALRDAIGGCLARAGAAGHRHASMRACDSGNPDWPARVAARVASWGLPGGTRASVTGAWHHGDGSGGCVDAVRDALEAAGMGEVAVLRGAVRMEWDHG